MGSASQLCHVSSLSTSPIRLNIRYYTSCDDPEEVIVIGHLGSMERRGARLIRASSLSTAFLIIALATNSRQSFSNSPPPIPSPPPSLMMSIAGNRLCVYSIAGKIRFGQVWITSMATSKDPGRSIWFDSVRGVIPTEPQHCLPLRSVLGQDIDTKLPIGVVYSIQTSTEPQIFDHWGMFCFFWDKSGHLVLGKPDYADFVQTCRH
jgi:hypothetical protein